MCIRIFWRGSRKEINKEKYRKSFAEENLRRAFLVEKSLENIKKHIVLFVLLRIIQSKRTMKILFSSVDDE